MNRSLLRSLFTEAAVCSGLCLMLAGCGAKAKENPAAEVPPPAQVVAAANPDVFKVDHPDQFPVVAATAYTAPTILSVTGTVAPDVSHNIPVVSLASGRVIEIDAKIGDQVQKGQRLMKIQSADISGAFADYRSAVADEKLARTQSERAKLLYDKGAIAQKDLDVAEEAAEKAKITVENASEKIRILGADINKPSAVIEVNAPASGVITEQNVTAAAGVKTLDNSPNLFTISDMSSLWILCDVYENDLKNVHLGETAEVRLNAYPDRVFQGKISDIGPVLDPTARTAKVRLVLHNPGMMRVGMFVTANFSGSSKQTHAQVPATAILHLHDKDWVYQPAGDGTFRRVQVVAGNMLPSSMQEIVSGLAPGDQVIASALVLQNTAEQ